MRAAISILLTAALPAQVPWFAAMLNPPGHDLRNVKLVRNGDVIHAFGKSISTNPATAYYMRSLDGGRTWPLRTPAGVAFAAGFRDGGLAVDGDDVHVAQQDPNGIGVWVRRSTDGGTTFLAPQTIGPGSLTEGPSIHTDGSVVNAIWTGFGVHASRSTDRGVTWPAAPTRLDTGLPTGNATDFRLHVLQDGPELHVFWQRNASSYYTVYQRSLDGGATWLPAARVLGTSPLVDAVNSPGTLLVQTGSILLRSQDRGTTWHPMPGHGFSDRIGLAMDGPNVLAVEQVVFGSGSVLRMSASTNAGSTWSTPFVHSSANQTGTRPIARVVGDAMFVHERIWPGSTPGRILQSDDFSASWRTLAGDAGENLFAWPDGGIALSRDHNASIDIRAWPVQGHTSLGSGTSGTAGIVPRLGGRGLAALNGAFQIELSAARGGALSAFFVSFGADAAIPIGSATLYLAQPIGPFPFTTTGTTGAPGVGTASLPVAVPADPSFAGMRMLSQAFVLDPASPGGFAATRAIETWLR